ncbi:hypothetical protein FQR65_LT05426 [Abscondita terminalis]|nr:hypothetical protein FQR65_LT05426 [Abscondita terminalis]
MDVAFGLFLVALLQNAFGGEFHFHPAEHLDESEVVGNAAARARLIGLQTRARVHALTQKANLRLHRPHLLLEQTPEEFLNSEAQPNDDPIVGAAQYYPQPQYEPDHAILSILPGQWKDNDYQGEYYDSYQVTPVSYEIPEDYPNYYYRNADPHKKSKKKHKKIAREEDEEEEQMNQRHFHKHKGHSHSFMYHGNAPLHGVEHDYSQSHPVDLHETFSSNANFHGKPPLNNQQKTVIVLPPHDTNFQVSQISGNHNAVSQSQSQFPHSFHAQTSQVTGTNNAANQWQAPFVGYAPDSVLGAPNIVQVKKNRRIWTIPGPEEADVSVVVKREALSPPRKKRTPGLARLLLDPNAQIDVPKTMENAGTVVRNSFENKHAPAYHLRNAAGSVRDAFISTLRIPPSNLLIPSKYKIVEQDELPTNGIVKEYPDETYNRVGEMFRDGVRSSQDTLTHIGDVMHSSRKALATTRTMAPRIVVSSLRIPAVQHPFIATIGENVAERRQVDNENNRNFIGVSHIMNSLGLSDPKIPIQDGNFFVYSDNPQEGNVYEMLNALSDAIKSMGATTLKDFFSKVKSFKAKQEKRMRKQGSRIKRVKNEDPRSDAIDELDMIVSLASNVTNDLLEDASKEASWDSQEEENEEVANFLSDLFNRRRVDDDERVGAINPVMFKKLFNTSLESAENDDEPVGMKMMMGKKLVTPFMGKLEKKEMQGYMDYDEDYYDDYRKRRSIL